MDPNLLFSECPKYDEKMIDAMIDKYCTVGAITDGEKILSKQSGIDVTKRINAIRQTLSETGSILNIFGDVELNIAKNR